MRGRLITFEGIDGAGKTTMLARAADWLRARGIDVLATREPGGTEWGRRLRALLMQQRPTAEAELLLFLADRAEHVASLIRPALQRGQWVLCDRYTDSTIAYQIAARGLDEAACLPLLRFAEMGVRPDRTFWFDVPVSVAQARLQGRGRLSRFDRDKAQQAIAEAYRRLAARDAMRIRRIDATAGPDAVFAQVQAGLRELLP